MRPGKKLVRYAISAFAGIAAELSTEVIIPGNTFAEKLIGIIAGILVGTGVNNSLDSQPEVVYSLSDQQLKKRLG